MKFLIEYGPLAFLLFILRLFPLETGRRIGRFLGAAAALMVRSRHRIARQNLLLCFPGISDRKAGQIIKGCWQNLGQSAYETAALTRLSKEEYLSGFDSEGLKHLKESLMAGTGSGKPRKRCPLSLKTGSGKNRRIGCGSTTAGKMRTSRRQGLKCPGRSDSINSPS